MRKLILALFILATLIFPQSEASAQNYPTCTPAEMTGAFEDVQGGDSKCPPATTKCTKVQTGITTRCYLKPVATSVTCRKIRTCNPGDFPVTNGTKDLCQPGGGGATYDATVTLDTANLCPADHTPSNQDNVATCTCNLNAGAGGTTPVADICKGNDNCTRGQGTRCDLTTGTPLAPGAKGDTGLLTAIGCVPTQPQALVEGLIRYGTLAAGGIAFLLMLIASIQMITSEGNPELIKASQEKFYSAIIGLLLIIFSVLLMQVIGVDLLDLPGFAK